MSVSKDCKIKRAHRGATQISALTLCAALAACGSPSNPMPSPTPNSADAAPPPPPVPDAAPAPSCSERLPLELGQCMDTTTSEPCLDFDAATQSFVPVDASSTVAPIVGLQGAPMFVMAVRGADISPGEGAEAPNVVVELTMGSTLVGSYNARPVVAADKDDASLMVAPQLFVAAFSAGDLAGQELQVRAEVEDKLGQHWCHEGTFLVGELIDSPALP